MTVRSLLAEAISPLHPDDPVSRVVDRCLAHNVRQLPIVADGELLGLVTDEHALDTDTPDAPVRRFIYGTPLHISSDAHPFEAARLLNQHQLTVLPVVSGTLQYEGVLLQSDLFNLFSTLLSIQEPGAIIGLRIDPDDFSISQLTYIFEQSGVKIRSISSEQQDSPHAPLHVTVKVDSGEISHLRHMLVHQGYSVVSYFNTTSSADDMQARAQEFLHYLSI